MKNVLLALLLLCPALLAQLDVPGDYATIQAAIDAAQPNDTITVHGGVYDPIVIDKPLTIVGEPSAIITLPDPSWPLQSTTPSIVRLAGPGYGSVTLDHMVIAASADGEWFLSCEPAIDGYGFSKLRVLNSKVSGTDIVGGAHAGAQGGHGIWVQVPLVIVERSHIRGGKSDTLESGVWNPDGTIGLAAETVVLLNSEVDGGTFIPASPWNPSPMVCEKLYGGVGGVGVLCATLFVTPIFDIEGGEGAEFTDPFDPDNVCIKPNGAPIVADTVVVLPDDTGGSWLGAKKP